VPVLQIPASYTARKRLVLNGTVYNPGATIPNATVKALKRLSMFLGNRSIVPNIDPYQRQNRIGTPTPTDLGPAARKAL
jgi:hypothetical protein